MPTEKTPDLLQTAAAVGAAKGRNIHDVVEASVSLPSLYTGVVDDGDDELSDETITRLLREAGERMKALSALSIPSSGVNKISMTNFPKLNPGSALANAPIKSQGSVSRISDPSLLVSSSDRELANTSAAAGGISRVNRKVSKKQLKEDKEKTAGASWFDMPRTDLTPQLKRDLQLIKMRNVLDPHRHYRKDSSALPEYSQVGTIIEGNTEFFSSRLTKKERKRTIVEEIMADDGNRKRFKKKYDEIQSKKRSGKKEFYKKLKEQRNGGSRT